MLPTAVAISRRHPRRVVDEGHRVTWVLDCLEKERGRSSWLAFNSSGLQGQFILPKPQGGYILLGSGSSILIHQDSGSPTHHSWAFGKSTSRPRSQIGVRLLPVGRGCEPLHNIRAPPNFWKRPCKHPHSPNLSLYSPKLGSGLGPLAPQSPKAVDPLNPPVC